MASVWTQLQIISTAADARRNASKVPHAALASARCCPGVTGQIVVDVEQSATNLATIAVKANASSLQGQGIHPIAVSVVGSAKQAMPAAKAIVLTSVAMTGPTAAGAGSGAVLVQIVAQVRANLCVEVTLPIVGVAGRSAKLVFDASWGSADTATDDSIP